MEHSKDFTQQQSVPACYRLPRIEIEYCTKCKWMLKAAYFAQELLSTFVSDVGEVALQPGADGVFKVNLLHAKTTVVDTRVEKRGTIIQSIELWDRKHEGGFPDAKELKRRLRDVLDPNRSLGHIDRRKISVADEQVVQNQGSAVDNENVPNSDDTDGLRQVNTNRPFNQPKDKQECEDCR